MERVNIKDMFFAKAYVQMFDLLDDCILVVDREHKIILYNQASEKLDGLSQEQVIGKSLEEVYRINCYTSSTLKALETKEPVKNLYQNYTTHTGKRISSISSSYPLIKENTVHGVITITKNITRYDEMMRVFHRHNRQEGEDDEGKAHYVFSDIIGQNIELKKALEIAKTAAKTNSNILLYGETGTGKELYAQSIHNESGARGKFVSINCAAIPENLLESMLFGTAKGAFTGAVDQVGLFEDAIDGTMFLDELNSMSLNLQSKLLRAVESGKIRRVGETKEKKIHMRVVTALNIHPMKAIEENIIRRDLYYRLGVVTVTIPPLRERKDDILFLIQYFIPKFNKKYHKNIENISREALEVLMWYDWPGNVRELEHAIEHSIIIAKDNREITLDTLPSFIKEVCLDAEGKEGITMPDMPTQSMDLDQYLRQMEKDIIEKSLEQHRHNVTKTAKALGLTRQTLDYRIKKLDKK